jgi:hypothetical protein
MVLKKPNLRSTVYERFVERLDFEMALELLDEDVQLVPGVKERVEIRLLDLAV